MVDLEDEMIMRKTIVWVMYAFCVLAFVVPPIAVGVVDDNPVCVPDNLSSAQWLFVEAGLQFLFFAIIIGAVDGFANKSWDRKLFVAVGLAGMMFMSAILFGWACYGLVLFSQCEVAVYAAETAPVYSANVGYAVLSLFQGLSFFIIPLAYLYYRFCYCDE